MCRRGRCRFDFEKETGRDEGEEELDADLGGREEGEC